MTPRLRRATEGALLAAALLGLPLLGARAAGRPASRYLEFPPRTVYVDPAPFSWPVFLGLAAGIAAAVVPFARRVARGTEVRDRGPEDEARRPADRPRPGRLLPRSPFAFPRWGWAGVVLGTAAWAAAWRPGLLPETLRRHTFAPLWLGYIAVVNGLAFRRSGRCPLTERPRAYLALFPASAVFWWFFEYLNRFVQNWHYEGIGTMGAAEYALYATLPFATVLPAVAATAAWLGTYPRLSEGLGSFAPLPALRRPAGCTMLAVAAFGLFGIGRWPGALFPVVWLAPLLLLAGADALAGRPHILSPAEGGDWRRIARWALAALVCGFFWEMWNAGSAARWVYAVPWVNRFRLFEMPLLGYAGYLPFGLACAAVADRVAGGPPQSPGPAGPPAR